MKARSTLRRATRCPQMRARRLPPAERQRCYRDQSQNPLNEDAGSRALARPAGLRASFTAAARALQSSCRSSRQKESLLALRAFFGGGESASPSLAPARAAPATSALAGASGRELQSSFRSSRQKKSLPVSLRRELALRTVFGGDGSTRLSLAPVRVTAFSGVAPGTSALAGAAGRVLQSSVRSPRQKESLSMSSRRELAVRTVFCTFFFGGDELATASLRARADASFLRRGRRDVAAGGDGVRSLRRFGRVGRRRGRCGRFAAAQGKSRDRRTIDCFPDPHHAWLGSDGGCGARTSR